MKRIIVISVFWASLYFVPKPAYAQSFEIEQLILDWQKLSELKNILKDLYTGYEILNKGYETIRNIAEGNFNLHKAFLDGLLAVNPSVSRYKRIFDIIDDQSKVLSEYKASYNRFKRDKNFTSDEIVYMWNVYSNLINESLENVENLLNVTTASKLRMSDDERLHAIDEIYQGSRDQLTFLRHFNSSTTLLAIHRAADMNDVLTLRQLYGVQ